MAYDNLFPYPWRIDEVDAQENPIRTIAYFAEGTPAYAAWDALLQAGPNRRLMMLQQIRIINRSYPPPPVV